MNNKVVKNAGWIIGCRIIQSLLGMVVSMLTARYLGPSNFGLINYAASITAFFVPLVNLGFNSVLVYEITNTPEEEGNILGTTIALSVLSSLLCILGVISFSYIANGNEIETIIVCAIYSVMLIFQATELIRYWFQAKLLSKYSAIVSLFAYFFVSVYKIIMLVFQKSVYWFAASHTLDYLIISVCLVVVYKYIGGNKLCFRLKTAKRILSKSKFYIVSAMMVTIFAQTDKVMLKLMIDDAATGFYSAAVSCASISSFVYTAIIDSFRPVIFQNHKENRDAFELSLKRLYSIIIYISIIQCIVMSLFSKLIILILYGKAYYPSIIPLKIVVWYTTFSQLGNVRNVWMLANNLQRYLWIINLSGAVTNIILNAILIPLFGVNGAAIASLATAIFTNFIVGFIIRPIRENNHLMIESLNPRLLVDMLRTIRR